ncbi:glycoside hydrolase family 3 N-terminal domain-containing protein [Fulvitalea axinellae]
MRNRLLALGLAVGMLGGIHCTALAQKKSSIYHKGWIDLNKNGKKDVYEDVSKPIEERVEDLLSQMSVEEKTCQMVTLYGYGRVAKDEIPTPEWKNELWKDGLGNIDEPSNGVYTGAQYSFPYGKHVWALNEIQKFFVEQTRLGIPVDFTDEGIRGLNHYKATSFPAQIGVGATWNKDLVHEIGKVIGKEAYALGYSNVYTPVLDVNRDQRWGRTVECFGEDPYLVGEYGVNITKGVASEGVANTLKHYAVYSAPKGGRDGHVRTDPHITWREVHQVYLYPFKKAIMEGGALGVMSSYNDYDGVPITGSKLFLDDILRKKYGFKGYVVTDSDALAYLYTKHRVADSYKEAVRQAVNAGVNVRTTFNDPNNFVKPLRELIQEGNMSMDVVNDRVRDVLYVKFREGLFDKPFREEENADKVVRSKKHLDLSLQASRESIVLLKNEGVLPLNKKSTKKVLVCGPMAKNQSASISRYGALGIDVVTGLRGIQEYCDKNLKGVEVDYALGSELHDKGWPDSEVYDRPMDNREKNLIAEAEGKAKDSDAVIVFVGEDETMVGENLSRTSLQLPGRQKDLVKAMVETGKPVVVVLLSGRPLALNYSARDADAILAGWFPGEFGGNAIADVIFGDYNPAGRLAMTFPRSVGQIPINFPNKPYSQAGQAHEGPNGTGDSRVVEPLYNFGYGLSYTNFRYSNLKIENNIDKGGKLKVSCDITNIGERAGDEVPQLYIKDDFSSIITYDWQLRGFDRVHIQPKETKTVTFEVSPQDLSLINRDMEEVTEAGTFKVNIGQASDNIRLKGEFKINKDIKFGKI